MLSRSRKKHSSVLHRLLILVSLIILTASLTGCRKEASAQNTAENKDRKTIIVGIDKFEPYSYQDVNGEYAGIDIELAKEAFDRLGYEPTFEFINWADKDDNLADGTIDCIWSCYSMTDREDKYQWAGPYMYSRQVVAVRASSNIYTIQDLAGKRIGVQATTKAENLFLHVVDSSLPQVREVNSFATTGELFAILRKDYVDAIAGHEALISKLIANGNGAYRMLEESPYVSEIGVAFQKDTHQELAQSLTEVLQAMKQEGIIGEIAGKYGLDPEKTVYGGETDERQ